jgi:hypothetical protein
MDEEKRIRATPARAPANIAIKPEAGFRPCVYLDSTISSYYFDDRPALSNEIKATQRWWSEESYAYEIWVSGTTLREIE